MDRYFSSLDSEVVVIFAIVILSTIANSIMRAFRSCWSQVGNWLLR